MCPYRYQPSMAAIWEALRGPTCRWKSQMQILTPNQWKRPGEHCVWIRESQEEAEEDGNTLRRPAVSTHLDPRNILDTVNNQTSYTCLYDAPYTFSRVWPCLASVREVPPNPRETWGPGVGQVWCDGYDGIGTSSCTLRRRNLMRSSWRAFDNNNNEKECRSYLVYFTCIKSDTWSSL